MSKHQSPAPSLDPDPIIWRNQLQAELRKHSDTIRRWLLDGTLPKPDINPTRKCMAWRLSTLRNAGFNIPWPR